MALERGVCHRLHYERGLPDDRAVSVVCAADPCGVSRFYIRKKVAKQMADSDRLAVNVNYKFDEEGIETTIDSENGKAEWQMFKKAAATKKNIIIYDAEKRGGDPSGRSD